jgi:hypothetical protein
MVDKHRLLVEMEFYEGMREAPACAGYRPHFALPGSQWLLGVVLDELEIPFRFDEPM